MFYIKSEFESRCACTIAWWFDV